MYDLERSPIRLPAPRQQKNLGVAYLLLLPSFFGLAGMHRFYLGRVGSGLIWLLTGGFCGIGTLIDAIMMSRMVDDTNRGADVW
jgi:TM2 domain-containing membrane protein YozV